MKANKNKYKMNAIPLAELSPHPIKQTIINGLGYYYIDYIAFRSLPNRVEKGTS